jgi:hypothetical protein
MTRQDTTPVRIDRIDHTAVLNAGWYRVVLTDGSTLHWTLTQVLEDLRQDRDEATVALMVSSTTDLLTKAYALTHAIDREHRAAGDSPRAVDLRAARDLITAEVLRRAGESA